MRLFGAVVLLVEYQNTCATRTQARPQSHHYKDKWSYSANDNKFNGKLRALRTGGTVGGECAANIEQKKNGCFYRASSVEHTHTLSRDVSDNTPYAPWHTRTYFRRVEERAGGGVLDRPTGSTVPSTILMQWHCARL